MINERTGYLNEFSWIKFRRDLLNPGSILHLYLDSMGWKGEISHFIESIEFFPMRCLFLSRNTLNWENWAHSRAGAALDYRYPGHKFANDWGLEYRFCAFPGSKRATFVTIRCNDGRKMGRERWL